MRTQGDKQRKTPRGHSVLGFPPITQSLARNGTILLIADDSRLNERLRALANLHGRIIVHADGVAGTLPIMRATRPAAVILDLDLPEGAGWEIAELLVEEATCPLVILLTARTNQLDVRTAIQAGYLLNKNESPSRILEAVEEALELPETNLAERIAIQRVLIGWLKPSKWAGSTNPTYRFWGINE